MLGDLFANLRFFTSDYKLELPLSYNQCRILKVCENFTDLKRDKSAENMMNPLKNQLKPVNFIHIFAVRKVNLAYKQNCRINQQNLSFSTEIAHSIGRSKMAFSTSTNLIPYFMMMDKPQKFKGRFVWGGHDGTTTYFSL